MVYRIVVIEDNSADVYLLGKALERAEVSFKIYPIEDGETAQSYIRVPQSALPDLIILDLHLPRIDGVKLLRLIGQQTCFESVPVIVWSSLPLTDDRTAMAELQNVQFICKPSSFDAFLELGAMIGRLLDSRTLPAARSLNCQGTP
jgi:DNA-binding response OmpR family regulator